MVMASDPHAVLKRIIEQHPWGIEVERVRELFWQQVKDDTDLLRAIADDVIRQALDERSFRTSSELPPKSDLH
jgi:hypothetical protein